MRNKLEGSMAFAFELRPALETRETRNIPSSQFSWGTTMLLKYLPKPGWRPPTIDVLRSVWPTAAPPATFAPPVDIDEDELVIS
jgi:hypothetical protein